MSSVLIGTCNRQISLNDDDEIQDKVYVTFEMSAELAEDLIAVLSKIESLSVHLMTKKADRSRDVSYLIPITEFAIPLIKQLSELLEQE